jgi:hypothetical protein
MIHVAHSAGWPAGHHGLDVFEHARVSTGQDKVRVMTDHASSAIVVPIQRERGAKRRRTSSQATVH